MDIQSLLFAIVQHEDSERATRALTGAGLRVTRISSIGGFLRAGNVTLLLGLARKDVALAIRLLSETCRQRTAFVNAQPFVPTAGTLHYIAPVEVQVGGATVFVLPIEEYIRVDALNNEFAFEPREGKGGEMDIKLILAIVPEELADGILDALVEAQYRATLISTMGGFLRKGNATLLICVQASKADDAMQRIERLCAEMLGKANITDPTTNIFVLGVEQYKIIGLETAPAATVQSPNVRC